ncbi:TetR/AcrR family transcriptional regulator [Lactiplantibacillus sp. WILCCON 0030]|uniref:TetR/AcrR family transcriptional regulator n=1 Tax=Lactiplantibacillus brownii TaxID=3069269 RepID=A0ABU1A8V8_9LACO|nr:TetR/AcrR family transcriptional regulator [Lactiplantibacillus brownii]MDQ7936785.1 TetR/AcrR family transcriptional regulator [Lactiplantibacillus brownii]
MIERHDLVIKLNHLILIRGFQKQSMSTFAKEAGVSRATLYLNFKNKDDLVRAVVNRHLTFIQQHPVAEFQAANFLPTWLNSLLLLGSTTTTFSTDLQVVYPELAQQLQQATKTYLADLLAYLRQAQTAHFLVSNLTPAFMLFQAQALVTQILAQVQDHRLSLPTAESYLDATLAFQLNGLVEPHQQAQLNPDQIARFKTTILAEFRATYTLIA